MSSVNGCFTPNIVCLGSCFLSSWITKVSNLNDPRVCPRLMVALSQNVGWAVAFILMDHKGK